MKLDGAMKLEPSAVRVAVIIPTWNRRVLLREVLESLSLQTLPPDRFEVVVVDDCSTDDTRAMLREFAATAPFRMVCHHLTENVGAVPARNIAVRLTTAPVLAFTDSDCRVVAEWLETGLAALDENPEIGFVSGSVQNKPGQRVNFFSIGAAGSGGEDPIYPTCNIMYRSEVFWSVDGFDERAYLRNSGGVPVECADADLAWRCKEAGHKNLFVPAMIVYHEVRQGTVGAWLAVQMRFLMLPELLRRHRGLRDKLMWWGPFCLRDSLLFYIAVLSVIFAIALGAWWLLGVAPYLINLLRQLKIRKTLPGIAKLGPQVVLLTARQAVISAALIYGSFRSRWVAL